ncbi:hypothetical protein JCM33374_g5478 [Metschnikowia sp. JCM 33374]|nr:hypothetical protein JCM33374_g5478 [Metschnikowia sp. JCM 33374]
MTRRSSFIGTEARSGGIACVNLGGASRVKVEGLLGFVFSCTTVDLDFLTGPDLDLGLRVLAFQIGGGEKPICINPTSENNKQ